MKTYSTFRQHLFPIRLLALLLFFPVLPVSADHELNLNAHNVMLHGYDPVAYYQDHEPKKGNNAYQASHEGGTYYFESEQNRDLFIATAERYAPEYGGYCSYGIRVGKKFDIDPHAWLIVDGRLFFQLDQGTHLVWEKDLVNNINIADKTWPIIKSKSAAELSD